MPINDTRDTLGQSIGALTLCAACGGHHLPTSPCVGRIEFAPYEPGPRPGAVPVDFKQFEVPRIEQKLDRIIELLERLASREGTSDV